MATKENTKKTLKSPDVSFYTVDGSGVIFKVTVFNGTGRSYFPSDLAWTWVRYFGLATAASWCSVFV